MVSDKVDLLATESAAAYSWLGLNRRHESVDYKCGEYVHGIVHTNNIESFWSLLKRGVIGTFHNISRKYLPLYLAEFQFRHNIRNNLYIFGARQSLRFSILLWRRRSGRECRSPSIGADWADALQLRISAALGIEVEDVYRERRL